MVSLGQVFGFIILLPLLQGYGYIRDEYYCSAYQSCAGDKNKEICKAFMSQHGLGELEDLSKMGWNGWETDPPTGSWAEFLNGTRGMTLVGKPCYGGLKSGKWANHWCTVDAEDNWDYAVLYGRDQYNRQCDKFYKQRLRNYCTVKNPERYGVFSGGYWGNTHPYFARTGPSLKSLRLCDVKHNLD